jgi:hypothetical protein
MSAPGEKLETYTNDTFFLFNQERDDMRKSDRNASLNQITTYIYQSLIDFQGKWEPSTRGSNVISFPNARYLAVGDKVTNITDNKAYLITEVLVPANRGGTVRLNLQGAPVPVEGKVLKLEEKNTVNFESSYSRYYQDKPITDWRDTIVFRVKRREPGTIGKHPFDPPTEIKPRIREYYPDTRHPGCHVMVMGQWFDNLIQFDCWSKFGNAADELIEWFEDFMYKYTWVWKKNGVNEILYWMRLVDLESTKFRNDLSVRTVIYYFKTEKIVTINEYDLRQIDTYLSVDNSWLDPSGAIGVMFGNKLPASGILDIADRSFNNVNTL